MDSLAHYDALYQLASEQVEHELFGCSTTLAREAFAHSMAGKTMPTVWFELPLLGDPRFDLHIAYTNDALHEEAPFVPEAADGHGDLLNWYASAPREGAGLALAYDVGEGRITHPAIHANVNGAERFDTRGFFSHVGSLDATVLHDGFVRRLPKDWGEWYFGIHPGRPGAPVRVDCFVNETARHAYIAGAGALEADLRQVGVDPTPAMLHVGAELARSPFSMELQFDVLADGSTGSTVSFSAGFSVTSAAKARTLWENDGDATRIMEFAQGLGMCDGRWRHVKKTLFTTLVNDGGRLLALYCVPVFAKLRLRDGEPHDTKIYLQAGVQPL